jgi:dTDP-glucose 4,6-dehydratase
VKDHCIALDTVLRRGTPGEIYNIGGENEWRNIDIVRLILKHLEKPESLIRFVKDRAGHDRRYAMDASRIIREFGWKPTFQFETGLAATIDWYLRNRVWWNRVLTGEYVEYYKRQYGEE